MDQRRFVRERDNGEDIHVPTGRQPKPILNFPFVLAIFIIINKRQIFDTLYYNTLLYKIVRIKKADRTCSS